MMRIIAKNRVMNLVSHSSHVHRKAWSERELVTGLISALKSGISLIQACEHVGYYPRASVTIERFSIRAVVRKLVRTPPHRHSTPADNFSSQLYAVCKLSETAGCSATRCLEILYEDIKRNEDRREQQKEATAIARLTLKVLLVLPVGLLALSWIAGFAALAFLCTSPVGWGCLAASGALYSAGFLWSKALLDKFARDTYPWAQYAPAG